MIAEKVVEGSDVLRSTFGRRVPPVGQDMQKGLRRAMFGDALNQHEEMIDVTVHSSVRQQPEYVESARVPADCIDRPEKRLIVEEIPGLDGLGDLKLELVHHPSSPDIEVANFGVSHLALHEPYGTPRGLEQRGWKLSEQLLDSLGLGVSIGIPIGGNPVTESVQDGKN